MNRTQRRTFQKLKGCNYLDYHRDVQKAAMERFDSSLEISTKFVLAAVILALDGMGWEKQSEQYWELLQGFNKHYTHILEAEEKLKIISQAEDIACASLEIKFKAEE